MIRLSERIVVVILFATVMSSDLQAQLSDSQRAQLVVDLRESAKQLDATRIPDLEPATAEFMARAAALHRYLEVSTSPENRDAWLQYFRFSPLLKAIEAGSSKTMLSEAKQLRDRLIGVAPGLEVRQVRDVRAALNQLIPAIQYQKRDRYVTAISNQMEKLATKFQSLDAVPSVSDASDAQLILSYLDEMNQDAAVIGTMRDMFSRPNIAIEIRESMIQELLGRGINKNQPVVDCILGTRIKGTANIDGIVSANLLPADNRVRLQLTMSGQLFSSNVGYNGPVRLRSTGYAGVCVTQTLNITESDIGFERSFADANLRTEINAIEHRLRLVRRIAWRKAREMKPQADRIAKAHLKERLAESFEQEIRQATSAAPPDPLSRVRPMLQRLELPEPPRFLNSTDDSIVMRSIVRRTDQIGSPVSAPPVLGDCKVAVQIHESAINNSFGHLLGGRTMTGKQLNELLSKTGRGSVDVQADDEKLKFEMDFDSVRPVVFEARDNSLRVGIRGTRFAEEGKPTRKTLLEVAAVYKPATMADGRAVLVRDGDVKVDFPKVRSPTQKAAMRGAVKDKLADAFPAIILDKPITVPEGAIALKGREFRPNTIDANDGWLTVTVR